MFDFERRICESARQILVAGGLAVEQVFVGATGRPSTLNNSPAPKSLSTPRVEIKFEHGGSYDQQRVTTDADTKRSNYNKRGGTLTISYVTDRDWNASSHSAFLNTGRKAIETALDAQWKRADDEDGGAYELFRFLPMPSVYEQRDDLKQDITRDSYDLVFEIPESAFTT